VNVALPSMQRDLHFSLPGAQWVVNAYVLTFAGFLLLGGRAGHLRSSTYLPQGLLIFTLASVGAGFAATATQIVAVWALHGLGGAILSRATLSIIVTADVERADARLASEMLNTSRQVGGSFSLAILGTVAADRTASFMNPHSSEALVSGHQRPSRCQR
jgi:hypothetical protein